ncbi:hypothetical protein LGL55_12650 [Clostridium tagluense]|uniref:ion channel n=1 Tax=Clostridium tagluense TaxID=360422 RepID=UPI001CF4618A|nr:ion channel [Clostridium tagluense]MCB2312183.1 hypothetical protein [Clostridium tagluense]MCB2316770.1 hypothetical protein [Clostridium tagluense]MCB2321630.1 hypothetical protein [Clostridium tagluense]MCB2326639.1 hypothetical protein [Clostridium tagluense]MCB2331362.1 hypothetical protein [Clostridium tagluense]
MNKNTKYIDLLSSSVKFDEEQEQKVFSKYEINKKYSNVLFNKCTFKESFFKNVEFINCKFDYCNIKDFILKNVKFNNCIFFFCNFDAVDLKCQFNDVNLFETHFCNDCDFDVLDEKSKEVLYDYPLSFVEGSKIKSRKEEINRLEFIRCKLHSVSFDNKNIDKALFQYVSFQMVNFKNNTNLRRVHFDTPKDYFDINFNSDIYGNPVVTVSESTIFPNMKELKQISGVLTLKGYLNEFIETFKDDELFEMIHNTEGKDSQHIYYKLRPLIYIRNFFATFQVLYEVKEFLYNDMSDTCNSIANAYKSNEMQSEYGEYYYLAKKLKHKTLKGKRKFKSNLSNWFCGYGERWWYGVFMSFAIIFICALFFMTGLEEGNHSISYYFTLDYNIIKDTNWYILFQDYWSCLYFSMMTFTTVGYGNMEAVGPISQVISFLEMFFGVIVIAVTTGSLLRKLFR